MVYRYTLRLARADERRVAELLMVLGQEGSLNEHGVVRAMRAPRPPPPAGHAHDRPFRTATRKTAEKKSAAVLALAVLSLRTAPSTPRSSSAPPRALAPPQHASPSDGVRILPRALFDGA